METQDCYAIASPRSQAAAEGRSTDQCTDNGRDMQSLWEAREQVLADRSGQGEAKAYDPKDEADTDTFRQKHTHTHIRAMAAPSFILNSVTAIDAAPRADGRSFDGCRRQTAATLAGGSSRLEAETASGAQLLRPLRRTHRQTPEINQPTTCKICATHYTTCGEAQPAQPQPQGLSNALRGRFDDARQEKTRA